MSKQAPQWELKYVVSLRFRHRTNEIGWCDTLEEARAFMHKKIKPYLRPLWLRMRHEDTYTYTAPNGEQFNTPCAVVIQRTFVRSGTLEKFHLSPPGQFTGEIDSVSVQCLDT
jgi:hypothetical protein